MPPDLVVQNPMFLIGIEINGCIKPIFRQTHVLLKRPSNLLITDVKSEGVPIFDPLRR
jgi:hypothetical protein